MGQDKATLEWNGKKLWEHQIEKLRGIRPLEIMVSAREEQELDLPVDIERIGDLEPDQGPLGGIIPSLRKCSTPFALVLAVDIPHMPSVFLETICDIANQQGKSVIPSTGKFFEPLAAVYSKDLLPNLEIAYEKGERSLQKILTKLHESIHVVEMEPIKHRYFRNMNSPEDLV